MDIGLTTMNTVKTSKRGIEIKSTDINTVVNTCVDELGLTGLTFNIELQNDIPTRKWYGLPFDLELYAHR